MTHRLTTNYAKNYCNRTLIVKVIVENVVTCFLGHGVVLKYAYFQIVCTAAKTMRLLSGHILPRNASNFTRSHLDLKNFPGRAIETPGPLLTGVGSGREGIKWFLTLNEAVRGRERRGRGGRRGKGKGRPEREGTSGYLASMS